MNYYPKVKKFKRSIRIEIDYFLHYEKSEQHKPEHSTQDTGHRALNNNEQ